MSISVIINNIYQWERLSIREVMTSLHLITIRGMEAGTATVTVITGTPKRGLWSCMESGSPMKKQYPLHSKSPS